MRTETSKKKNEKMVPIYLQEGARTIDAEFKLVSSPDASGPLISLHQKHDLPAISFLPARPYGTGTFSDRDGKYTNQNGADSAKKKTNVCYTSKWLPHAAKR
ncbi:hypothetical protein Trydic_g2777 [Trypoxylus dichotomus]